MLHCQCILVKNLACVLASCNRAGTLRRIRQGFLQDFHFEVGSAFLQDIGHENSTGKSYTSCRFFCKMSLQRNLACSLKISDEFTGVQGEFYREILQVPGRYLSCKRNILQVLASYNLGHPGRYLSCKITLEENFGHLAGSCKNLARLVYMGSAFVFHCSMPRFDVCGQYRSQEVPTKTLTTLP